MRKREREVARVRTTAEREKAHDCEYSEGQSGKTQRNYRIYLSTCHFNFAAVNHSSIYLCNDAAGTESLATFIHASKKPHPKITRTSALKHSTYINIYIIQSLINNSGGQTMSLAFLSCNNINDSSARH